MIHIHLPSLFRGHRFLLGLILFAFFGREIFLVAVFPLYTGQDEARHYNTIQWLADGRSLPQCQEKFSNPGQDKNDLSTYRFSEEIRESSVASGANIWREENYRKALFAPGNTGSNENLIESRPWTIKMSSCPPPDIALTSRGFSLYHQIASFIERALGGSDVLTRFFLIRIFSVFLGALAVFLVYLAAREAGFSARISLLITFIFSLQPRLTVYLTNINYDALLILAFTLFLYAGVRTLRRGFSLWHIFLLTLSLTLAILTKDTGLILLGGLLFLIGWSFYKKYIAGKMIAFAHWVGGLLLLGLFFFIANKIFPFPTLFSQFSFPTFFEYLEKTILGWPSPSGSFWGSIDWTWTNLGPVFVWILWIIEIGALAGLFVYFRKKDLLPHLPSKLITVFLILLIVLLEIGIRIADWRVYQGTGSLALGTPGRYFLPTLSAQLILVAIGLGALLKKPLLLERALLVLTLIVLMFYLYNTWLIIIPRFYL